MGTGWVDPGGGGGGGGAASGVSLVPLAPDTSTDVQDAYEYLHRNTGETKHVATLADLDDFAPDIGGGRRLIAVSVEHTTAFLELGAGEYLDFAPGGAWQGPGAQAVLQGASAGGLVRGAPIILRTVIVNVAGPELALDGTAGSPVVVSQCAMAGPFGAGSLTAIANFALISECTLASGGLSITGSSALIRLATCVVTVTGTGTGVALDAAAIVSQAVEFLACEFITSSPAQTAIDLNSSATLLQPGVSVKECKKFGPGAFFKAGGFDQTSLEVIATGNVGVRDSVSEAASAFQDLTNFVTATSALGVWAVVPHIGAGQGLIALPAQERWRLIDTLDGSDLIASTPATRWALELLGPQAISGVLVYSVTAKSGGGGSAEVQHRLEVDLAADGTWVPVEGSERTSEVSNQWRVAAAAHAPISDLPPLARVRLASTTIGAATDTDIGEYHINGGSPSP